jgi:hypothetical protein
MSVITVVIIKCGRKYTLYPWKEGKVQCGGRSHCLVSLGGWIFEYLPNGWSSCRESDKCGVNWTNLTGYEICGESTISPRDLRIRLNRHEGNWIDGFYSETHDDTAFATWLVNKLAATSIRA